jgi:hypothetical protein
MVVNGIGCFEVYLDVSVLKQISNFSVLISKKETWKSFILLFCMGCRRGTRELCDAGGLYCAWVIIIIEQNCIDAT